MFEQSKNERLLVDNLHDLGVDVMWNQVLDALNIVDDGVVCSSTGRAPLNIRARYCVGADGSSSVVRNLVGIDFDGATNQHTFYVLDATGVSGLALDSINLRFGERDFLLTFPMGSTDHQRLVGVVRNDDGLPVTEGTARATLDRAFGVHYNQSAWFSTYRVHHRVARRFRRGPVFLAGDAAHVHSPVGAQGMNTGLPDAHNLACKLADVLTGRAPDVYLDRYEAERWPVDQRLVSTTDTMFGVITSEKCAPRLLRRWVVPRVAPIAASLVPRFVASSRIFEYLAQTRIHYWMSDHAKQDAHGRRGKVLGRRLDWNGDNFESLRTMTWQVHAYGQIAPEAADQLEAELGLSVRVFPEIRNRRLRPGKVYLIRPDGFVAAIASPESAADLFRTAQPRRPAT